MNTNWPKYNFTFYQNMPNCRTSSCIATWHLLSSYHFLE